MLSMEMCTDMIQFKSLVLGSLVLLLPLVVLSAFLFSSGSVSANGFNHIVTGEVFDENGNSYVGVTVTVNMWTGGIGGVLHVTHVNGPSPDGWYIVTFLDGEWAALDTIQVIAVKPGGGGQAESATSCDATGSQFVDVHFGTAIPQFGNLVGAFAATCLVGSIAIVTIRKKRSSV